MTPETLNAQSAFFTYAQQRLKAARNAAELEKAATLLDQPEFNALPEGARLDLGVLYSHRLQIITGWGAL